MNAIKFEQDLERLKKESIKKEKKRVKKLLKKIRK